MVYCVEDDASIRELALYALTQAGIEAEGMANDVEFRAACARRLPDVVMLPAPMAWKSFIASATRRAFHACP